MIILSGPPGSGKTTQSKILAQSLGCPHFSVGELLRDELGEEQIVQMRRGELLSDDVVIPVIERKLEDFSVHEEIVTDGFLRTVEDVKWLKRLTSSGKVNLTAIIFLELDDNEIKDRLEKRHRLDDSEKSIDERIEIYHSTVKAVKESLKDSGLKFHELSGEGSINEVAARIQAVLK